jgi:hypothetical protein
VTINLERESELLKQRSLELAQLLDAGHPALEPIAAVWAERKKLAAATHQARRDAAARVAAGADTPGVTVGHAAPIRRTKTDWRGVDTDPFHGSPVVTPQLIAYWEHQRDVVSPAIEAQYRRAATDRPYQPALVAAARGHLGVLRERRTMLSEDGTKLEASLAAYDQAYERLRVGALDSQSIRGEAMTRLAALRRITVDAEMGDQFDERPFIASALSATTDLPINADTGTPLVAADSGK